MERQTYSQRKYANRMAFNYYNFGDELRAVLYRIVVDNLPPGLHEHLLAQARERAHGVFTGDAFHVFADMERFFHKAPSIYVLDGIELFVAALFEQCNKTEREIAPVVEAINRAFADFNAGFFVVGRLLLQQQSRYYDVEVIRRVYELLFAPGFEEALVNFQHALGWLRHDPVDWNAVAYYAQEALRQTVMELLRRHVNPRMPDQALHQALVEFSQISKLPAPCVAALRATADSFRNIMAACEVARNLPRADTPHTLARFALNIMAAGLLMIMQTEREYLHDGGHGGKGNIEML